MDYREERLKNKRRIDDENGFALKRVALDVISDGNVAMHTDGLFSEETGYESPSSVTELLSTS